MWLTGFDAPSLHTLYIDKPMRDHGLLQGSVSGLSVADLPARGGGRIASDRHNGARRRAARCAMA